MPKMPNEVEAFQGLTDALDRASSFALDLARLRPDQSFAWEKMSETYRIAREAVFRLAGEGAVHSKQ